MNTLQSVPEGRQSGAALPTLAEVLELPALRRACPRIVAGARGVGRSIRWVHVSELTDIATLLRGGEMVLSTGIGLPSRDHDLRDYVTSLASRGTGALALELGRRYDSLPPQLLDQAERCGLPIVALEREVPFVEITEAVHTWIVNARVHQLEKSEAIHRRFTHLSLEGASMEEILEATVELGGTPLVVLENLAHRVITFSASQESSTKLLYGWGRQSRMLSREVSTHEFAPGEVWTLTPVGARGEHWGRLVAVTHGSSPDIRLVLERAANALALLRLSERDNSSVTVRAHRDLLTQITDRTYSSIADIQARTEAVGVPIAHRDLLGASVHFSSMSPEGRPAEEAFDNAESDLIDLVLTASANRLAALVDSETACSVRLLVAVPRDTTVSGLLDPFARALHEQTARLAPGIRATIGIGSIVPDLANARQSLVEASQVAVAATASTDRPKPYYELIDVRVRGLIHLMRHDVRLQNFVERELAALISIDAKRRTDYVPTLEAYLRCGQNKSKAAEVLHLSRQALYGRLDAIGKILDADLDDSETCLSLHVALLGLHSMRMDDSRLGE